MPIADLGSACLQIVPQAKHVATRSSRILSSVALFLTPLSIAPPGRVIPDAPHLGTATISCYFTVHLDASSLSSVHGEDGTGHERGLVGGQEQHHAGQLLRPSKPLHWEGPREGISLLH